jgi:PEP-CTERM motif
MCNYGHEAATCERRVGHSARGAAASPRGLVRAAEKEHTLAWRTERKVAPAMRKTVSAIAVLTAGMALLTASSARAVTLMSLINSPVTTGTPYNLFFTATGPQTTISIGGYDNPAFEYVYDLSAKLDGKGPNLLGGSWTFTPAPLGSEATEFDGLLKFGDIAEGNYDTFSQTFASVPGGAYLLSFRFANSIDGSSFPSDPNGLLVTTSGELARTPAVPEPTTWIMAILGFVGLGLVGYRRRRTTQSRSLSG